MPNRLAALVAASLTLTLSPLVAPHAHAAAAVGIDRISGLDRYAVAAGVSRSFATPGGTVFVASGEVFPDALAGGPAAARSSSPLLLVTAGSVPPATAAELDRLAPAQIVVLGGPGTVSDAVVTGLQDRAPTTRISGADRYAVAAAVAQRFPSASTEVVVASGEVFSDALPAGAAAAHLGGPLLLARASQLPAATEAELQRLAPATVHVVGGPATIGDAVLARIQTVTGATVVRHGGADRYAVAAGLAGALWPDGFATAFYAGGTVFADGLAATPAAAAASAPLLLSSEDCMPDATAALAAAKTPSRERFVGGPASLSTAHEACSTPASAQTSVYVIPHQDDELISMVGGVTADVVAGRDVWVVKINRGDWSSAYDQLCQQKGYCLSRVEFGAARDRELVDSAVAMGVRADHVVLNHVIEQNPGYNDEVDRVVAGLVDRFGRDARFNAISFLDLHSSHAPVGYDYKMRCEGEGLSRCRWFQSPLYQPGSKIATKPVEAPAALWLPASSTVVTRAVNAYKKWDPANGRYAIGWLSVQNQLSHTMSHPGSLVHRDTRFYNEAQRLAAQRWIDANQSPDWWTFRTVPVT